MTLSVLFQTPEMPVTLILFPDALFVFLGRAVGEAALCLSTLRAVVFGQRKEWLGLLRSTQ